MYLAVIRFIDSPDLDLGINLVLGGLFLVMFVVSWRYMRPSFRIYSFLITWISFSDFTGIIHPYMGLPRHLWLAFPVFLSFSVTIQHKWVRVAYIFLQLLGMHFLLLAYVVEAWVL